MRFGLMFIYPAVNNVNVGSTPQTPATTNPSVDNQPENPKETVETEKISVFSNYDTSQDGQINNADTKHQSIFQLDTGKLNALKPTNISDNASNLSSIRKIANAQIGGVSNKFSAMVTDFAAKIGSKTITQKVGDNFKAQNEAEIQSITSDLNAKVENKINEMSNKYNQMVLDLYSQALNDVAQQIGDSNPEIPQGGENDKFFVDKMEQPEGIGTGRNADGSIKHHDGTKLDESGNTVLDANIKTNRKEQPPEVKTEPQSPEVKTDNQEPDVKETGLSDETMDLEAKIEARIASEFGPQPGSLESDGAIGTGTKKKYGTSYATKGTITIADAAKKFGVSVATLEKFNPNAAKVGKFENGNDIYIPFNAQKTQQTTQTSAPTVTETPPPTKAPATESPAQILSPKIFTPSFSSEIPGMRAIVPSNITINTTLSTPSKTTTPITNPISTPQTPPTSTETTDSSSVLNSGKFGKFESFYSSSQIAGDFGSFDTPDILNGSGFPSDFPRGSNMPKVGQHNSSILTSSKSPSGAPDLFSHQPSLKAAYGSNTHVTNQFKELGVNDDMLEICTLKYGVCMDLLDKQNSGVELSKSDQNQLQTSLDFLKRLHINCDEQGNLSKI